MSDLKTQCPGTDFGEEKTLCRLVTTRPDIHGRVVLVPYKSDASVRYYIVAHDGQVMF